MENSSTLSWRLPSERFIPRLRSNRMKVHLRGEWRGSKYAPAAFKESSLGLAKKRSSSASKSLFAPRRHPLSAANGKPLISVEAERAPSKWRNWDVMLMSGDPTRRIGRPANPLIWLPSRRSLTRPANDYCPRFSQNPSVSPPDGSVTFRFWPTKLSFR